MPLSPTRVPPSAHPIPTAQALLLLVLFLSLAACDGEANARGDLGSGRLGPPVVIGNPHMRDFSDRIEALGTAKANESVVITARVTETVQRVTFEDGATVEAGEVLVELTSTEESAQLDEARAQHTDARRRYERVVDLHRQGTESESRLDSVSAQLDAAHARLASTEPCAAPSIKPRSIG